MTVVWLRPPNAPADGGKREVGVLAREVHGDLARPDERGRRGCGESSSSRVMREGLADGVLDRLERGRAGPAPARPAARGP